MRFRTFGSVRIEAASDDAAAVLSQPKRLALLVYLALARPHGSHRRDTLLAIFWPELDQARARHALSQSLHFLRRCLGADAVVTHLDDVALNGGQGSWDALEFDDALSRGDGEGALALYEGDFLSGFHLPDAPEFERWADAERSRYRAAAIEAAYACTERAHADGRRREAVAWAARAVSFDDTNERALRRLMRARDAAGDRAEALRDYREFVARLARELDAEPSPETQQLAGAIRQRSEAGDHVSGDFRRNPQPSGLALGGPATPILTPPALPAVRAKRLRLPAWVALVAIALLGVGTLAVKYADAVTRRPAVAVLPFAWLGADARDAYLGDELTEDLTTALSAVQGLSVTARTSAFAWKGTQVDVREVGRRLNVTLVLEGSVRHEGQGDSLRVTAQLIDAVTGYHLWSGAWRCSARELDGVPGEITRQIARRLQLDGMTRENRR